MALDLTPTRDPTPQTRGASRRIPGLDGLRALAVVAVLLYHGDWQQMKGGFIGVDIFFVLSGYLMATITLDSVRRTGGLGLRRFWAGRLRRLMPAQVTLMVVVTLVVALWHRDELYELRGQVIAGLTATMNWFLIATEGSYFEQLGRPPVLRHLWSLAIEMQFYLVFPPLLAFLLTRTKVRRDQIVIALGVLSVASAVYMAVLFDPDGDPSRAYYSTLARICAPLIGAALALLWQPSHIRRAPIMQAGGKVTAISMAALGLLAVLAVRTADQDAWMYRGGFLFVAIVSAVVVAGIVHPGSALGGRKLLGHPLLVAIGLRSYSLYLWHWPIYALIRPRIDVSWSWGTTFVIRLALTLVCAELCYRYVEKPWHRRSPSTRWRRIFALDGVRLDPKQRRPTLAAFAAIAVAAGALALAQPTVDAAQASLEAGAAAIATTVPTNGPAPTTTAPPKAGETTAPTTTLPLAQRPITFVGDSVMLGAAPALVKKFAPGSRVNAEESRQAKAYPGALEALAAAAPLGSDVVIQVGNNGTVTEEEIEAIAAAAPDANLYFLTVRVPRTWETGVNDTLKKMVPKLKRATLIDWRAASEGNLAWFYDDGIHLKPEGQTAYADLVAEALAKGN